MITPADPVWQFTLRSIGTPWLSARGGRYCAEPLRGGDAGEWPTARDAALWSTTNDDRLR
jgi:hypothetical protein